MPPTEKKTAVPANEWLPFPSTLLDVFHDSIQGSRERYDKISPKLVAATEQRL